MVVSLRFCFFSPSGPNYLYSMLDSDIAGSEPLEMYKTFVQNNQIVYKS